MQLKHQSFVNAVSVTKKLRATTALGATVAVHVLVHVKELRRIMSMENHVKLQSLLKRTGFTADQVFQMAHERPNASVVMDVVKYQVCGIIPEYVKKFLETCDV